MSTPTKPSVDPAAHRKPNTMTTANAAGMEFLYPMEVASLLRVSRVSVYRMVAKGLLPAYRVCRKMLFRRQDILEYLERSKIDPYGRTED